MGDTGVAPTKNNHCRKEVNIMSSASIHHQNSVQNILSVVKTPAAKKKSLVSVHNEWDPLEEIIVGNPAHAAMPHVDQGFKVIQKASHDLFDSLSAGAFPQKIIEETEEDIQVFIGVLEKLG